MSTRERLILKRMFEVLAEMPGGQSEEGILFSSVELLAPKLTRGEFDGVLRAAESNSWVLRLPSKFGTIKCTLTDQGRAAREELGEG